MKFVSVPSGHLGAPGATWQARHYLAMAEPLPTERRLVELVLLVGELVQEYGEDRVLREGVASILNGTGRLLNADWGTRLDMGTVDSQLLAYAEAMNYDRGMEEFTD